MIPPSNQWAIQIDVTNACHLHCSNCTRLLDHAERRFFMSPECFARAVAAVKDFPRTSGPCPRGRRKVVGIIGGEPLLHPQFPALVDIIVAAIPDARHRGLWTSKDWKTGRHQTWGPYRPQVERLLGIELSSDGSGPSEKHRGGFLNWNMHLPEMDVHHQPLLVAARDVVADERRRWELIERCWVQRSWSSTCTPKGFFFCEVAGHFDMIFDGPGGLPLEPGVWRGDLAFVRDAAGVPRPRGPYAEQIARWCDRCGAAVPMPGRRDAENRDDVSPSNLIPLEALRSPRVIRGEIVVHADGRYDEMAERRRGWRPGKYVKGTRPADQSVAAHGADRGE